MKHPQHILAFDKAAFGINGLEGLVTMSPKSFFESAQKSLFIGRRHELEADERFGQVLPYVVLTQKRNDGLYTFVYQRTKLVGESRLAGALSIGGGGHVDLSDVRIGENSVIDIVSTFATAIARELNEEFGFKRYGTDEALRFDGLRHTHEGVFPKFIGVINDTSDSVGLVHYGCLFALDVPDDFEPYCLEDELKTIGMVRADDAAAKGESAFENWSMIVLKNIELLAK